MYRSDLYDDIRSTVEVVDYSQGYRLGDFDCGIADYNDFLRIDAPYYIKQNVTQIKLLVNKENADVIAYMALCSDSFILSDKEKTLVGLEIPINTLPSLKIGKLAVSQRYKGKLYGSFMLFLAMGYSEQLNEFGVGCRFLVVDADIQRNPEIAAFYEKNGFIYNERVNRTRTESKSMRYDVFYEVKYGGGA